MFFKQFYLESLGHASYLIGSDQTGEAFVFDPRRDVDLYFEEARAKGMQIRYAVDSHQHNDYLTGARELAARAQAKILAAPSATLRYPAEALSENQTFQMGEVSFQVLHTPGHTPEHISLLVTDLSRGKEPSLLLSGGSLLVGAVGRPDLLGKEHLKQLVSASYQTLLGKILTLPDFVEVYPTHVTGSLCGGNIGSRLSTTIGYERRLNKVLASLTSEENFSTNGLQLARLPGVPAYWKRMRKMNQEGPPLLGSVGEPAPLNVEAFDALRKQGGVVLDCRSVEAFSTHIPGALHVELNPLFAVWAGSFLPSDRDILLVLDHPDQLWEVCWHLLRIGYDLPKGWLSGGMRAWRIAAKELDILTQWPVGKLNQALQEDSNLILLDVRQCHEWNAGHISNGKHISGAEIPERIKEIPKDRTVAVICGSGYRSSVVASFMKSQGYDKVVNVLGGMTGWKSAGFPVIKESDAIAV